MTDPAEPPDVVWALDLRNGLPYQAHEIVEKDDQHAVTACGQVRTAAVYPTGWWSCRPGELPLADHAIHCRSQHLDETGTETP